VVAGAPYVEVRVGGRFVAFGCRRGWGCSGETGGGQR
jgi:hypothetical protein